jgi:hypothetical protein
MSGKTNIVELRALRERAKQCKGTPGEKEAAFDYGAIALAKLPGLLDELERLRAERPGWAEAIEAAARVLDEFARDNRFYSARAQWAGNIARTIRALEPSVAEPDAPKQEQ